MRNSFLAAAYELRNGIAKGASPKGTGPDMIRAMTTELWLDYIAIRLDGEKVNGAAGTINLVTPDVDEEYVVELSNETLTTIEGYQAKNRRGQSVRDSARHHRPKHRLVPIARLLGRTRYTLRG